MSDKPKRKFWQFHLSTLVGIAFLSGLLLWLNLKQLHSSVDNSEHIVGYPVAAIFRADGDVVYTLPDPNRDPFQTMAMQCLVSRKYSQIERHGGSVTFKNNAYFVSWWLMPNLLFATGCVFFLAVLIEAPIRRREARKSREVP